MIFHESLLIIRDGYTCDKEQRIDVFTMVVMKRENAHRYSNHIMMTTFTPILFLLPYRYPYEQQIEMFASLNIDTR